jgi:hypothetical protein
MDLEEEFDIGICDDDIEGTRTAGHLVRIVEASLAAYRDPYFNARERHHSLDSGQDRSLTGGSNRGEKAKTQDG